MKKFIYVLLLLLAGMWQMKAGQPNPVRAYFNYAVFYAPEKGTYIETYLTVTGNSVYFKKNKNQYMATVHVDFSLSQNGNVVVADAYNMNSAEITDTVRKPVFTGIQRYPVKPGRYDLTLKIRDANRNGSELSAVQTIEITSPKEGEVSFSDVELLEGFTKTQTPNAQSKSGYDVIPYAMRYYPENFSKLVFYSEAYNTAKKLGPDGRFLFVYYVEGTDSAHAKLQGLYAYSKQKAAEVNPIMGQFDISQVPTGEYNLVIEVRSEKNDLIAAKKLPFTRIAAQVKIKLEDIAAVDTAGTFISHIQNTDTLKDYIACLWPISSTTERDWQYNQIRNADAKLMQQYIYAFWMNREPKRPEEAWKKYRGEANKVKKEFACGKIPGYMTDRGRVYLQYGAPSAAQQQPAEPDSYPYEIWQYYRLKDPTTGYFQSNKKFVFYNRELDGKCYQLIHSDARGELRDDRWQIKLKQRTNQIMNFDETDPNNTLMNMPGRDGGTKGSNSYGSGADDLFQNPR